MHLLTIGAYRINADHINTITTDTLGPDGETRVFVWGTGHDNQLAHLNGEAARALLAWWDAAAEDVLDRYRYPR